MKQPPLSLLLPIRKTPFKNTYFLGVSRCCVVERVARETAVVVTKREQHNTCFAALPASVSRVKTPRATGNMFVNKASETAAICRTGSDIRTNGRVEGPSKQASKQQGGKHAAQQGGKQAAAEAGRKHAAQQGGKQAATASKQPETPERTK